MDNIDLRFIELKNLKNTELDKINLTVPPPEVEPQRQYYFIAKAKTYVKTMSVKLGRPLFYYTETFGCPKVYAPQICGNP